MAKRFNVIAEARRVERSMSRWGKAVTERALPRAMNRVATTARSRGVKVVASNMGIAQREVRKGTRIQKANRRRPLSAVIFAGRPLTLIAFNARQTRRGLTAKAWGKRKLYRGAFIARMPTGKLQTVARKGSARLPLKTLFGPSIPRTASMPATVRIVNQTVRDRFDPEMRAALRSVVTR